VLVLQAIIEGVLVGGFYALMAAGLTLVFGVMDIVNFAIGALIVLGAYLSYSLTIHFHIDPFVSLIFTTPLMTALGMFIYVFLIKPIKTNKVVMSLLTMFAVATLIEGILDICYNSGFVQIHASYINNSLRIGKLNFPLIYVLSFLLSAFLLSCLYLVTYRTKFGRSLRASMQNPVAARLVGIDTDRVSMITLGIGIGLAAIGGMIFGTTNAFNASSSYDIISRLLVIVILGGFGSVGGALVAAVFMLVIQDVVAVVWSPVWGSTAFYMILMVVLLVRPQGLFGKKGVRAQ
jgi:branched-chain amino acid transport system permease protein